MPEIQLTGHPLSALGVSYNQQFPTFLAPGIGFVGDHLSTDWGEKGMVSG